MSKLTIDLDNYSDLERKSIQNVLKLCDPMKDAQEDFTPEDPVLFREELTKTISILEECRENFYKYIPFVDAVALEGISLSIQYIHSFLICNTTNTQNPMHWQRMADRRKRIGIFENKMMEFADGYGFDNGGLNCYITYIVSSWEYQRSICDNDPLVIYMTEYKAKKAAEWANRHYPEGL